MERVKHKSKKDKQQKQADKDNSSTFISDVKSIKENLKIKEILRTVKMNSSMRIKAPRGSKVMNNKDFNHNDDIFEEDHNHRAGSDDHLQSEPSPSATNRDVILNPEDIDIVDTKEIKTDTADDAIIMRLEGNKHEQNEQKDKHDSHRNEMTMKIIMENDDAAESSNDSNIEYKRSTIDGSAYSNLKFPVDNRHIMNRDRKLSLDQTMLTRREGLSQSELDLNSIGKSPLERKSSFFRKKMESFFKNTTEIFKRQSLSGKPDGVQRRGSMSASLQSLNEKTSDYSAALKKNSQGSSKSLRSSSTLGRSTTSLSASQATIASEADTSEVDTSEAGVSEVDSLAGSQPFLSASQPLEDVAADSVQSLQEAYAQDSFLNSRAISMSSGLDAAHSTSRRRSNTNRSNRVTWVASEGLAHYFRRLIQDEKSKEMQVCHSYSDFTTIPEYELSGTRVDARGRRLSYQRAVSGEEPGGSLRRRALQPQRERLQCATTCYEHEMSATPQCATTSYKHEMSATPQCATTCYEHEMSATPQGATTCYDHEMSATPQCATTCYEHEMSATPQCATTCYVHEMSANRQCATTCYEHKMSATPQGATTCYEHKMSAEQQGATTCYEHKMSATPQCATSCYEHEMSANRQCATTCYEHKMSATPQCATSFYEQILLNGQEPILCYLIPQLDTRFNVKNMFGRQLLMRLILLMCIISGQRKLSFVSIQ
ncbi:hypothetical protein O0L34_g2202 [Tuta absoluta]|nr:hypothetical protein O0L34_g2202 [Tuta absoluta]